MLRHREHKTEADKIKTPEFSKRKHGALVEVRIGALESLRGALNKEGYREVTTSSLVNIAGSCENPYFSFGLDFYGRKAFLSQSAQLQLETIVLRLGKKVFTVNSSFREEDYIDPKASGRRLSEFTLIEPEGPFPASISPSTALHRLMGTIERVVRSSVSECLSNVPGQIEMLGGDLTYLKAAAQTEFKVISYVEALGILRRMGKTLEFGADLGIAEEQMLLEHFSKRPLFVTHHPASIKFFNAKGAAQKTCHSVDLLLPKLGETVGGALREEDGAKVRQQLLESRIAKFCRKRKWKPEMIFHEYLKLFEEEEPVSRGGFGIGFERFVAFLLSSNDILETIRHRSFVP
ncbi:MAG: amino acid--tRNA ligase-related protein [Candidatus Micrarchaeota archaeon]